MMMRGGGRAGERIFRQCKGKDYRGIEESRTDEVEVEVEDEMRCAPAGSRIVAGEAVGSRRSWVADGNPVEVRGRCRLAAEDY